MTDNEIIKALECCANEHEDCKNCPVDDFCKDHSHEMVKAALDLINRQKAENSNLTSHLTSLQNDLTSLQNDLISAKAEIERLKAERDKEHDYCNHYARMCAKAKTEAIKEFVERLKENSTKTDLFCNEALVEREYKITEDKLDNLVKEMVGETNA